MGEVLISNGDEHPLLPIVSIRIILANKEVCHKLNHNALAVTCLELYCNRGGDIDILKDCSKDFSYPFLPIIWPESFFDFVDIEV